MKQVTINLYSFSELSKEAQQKAIYEHKEFLLQLGEESENEDGEMITEYPDDYEDDCVIENIEANEYIYFEDGQLASCTTYTGEHEKSGITELKFHGRIYDITNTVEMLPRSVAFSIANRFYGSDYNMSKSTFDNAVKELGY